MRTAYARESIGGAKHPGGVIGRPGSPFNKVRPRELQSRDLSTGRQPRLFGNETSRGHLFPRP